MAISINWGTKVIYVPKADTTLVQASPTEIRELDINILRLALKDLEDSEEGMPYPRTHNNNPPVNVGGVSLARVVEILDPYTITFEDGQYAVNLYGANSNVGDKVNVNQVSIRSANSAGLVNSAEIEYGSFDGGVHIDVVNGVPGTIYPTGTPRQPVNNLADALLIASRRGFIDIHVIGNLNILTEDVSSYIFNGQSPLKSVIYVDPGANVADCEFFECTLTGTLDGSCQVRQSAVSNLFFVNGGITECYLMDNITMGGTSVLNILNCVSGSTNGNPVVIDMGGDCGPLSVRNYSGAIKLVNKTGTDRVTLDIAQGHVYLDSTVTDGTITCRGIGVLENNSTGNTVVIEEMINPKYVNNSLYTGGAVHIDVVNGKAGTLFPIGTFLTPVNNISDAKTIADTLNLKKYSFKGTLTVTTPHDNWTFEGKSSILSDIVVLTGQSVNNINCINCTVTGSVNGSNQQYNQCFLTAISGVQGLSLDSALDGLLTLSASGTFACQRFTFVNNAVVDINGVNSIFQASVNVGDFTIINSGIGSFSQVSLSNMSSLVLDSSNVSGSVFQIVGIGKVTNNTTGSTVLDSTYQIPNSSINTQVDELHKLAGLQISNPLVVSSTSRTAGSISQTISGDDPVTVQRL